MKTSPLNNRYEKIRHKVSTLCEEKQYEAARKIWEDFLNSVISDQEWEVIKDYSEECINQLPDFYFGYLSAGIACFNLKEYLPAIQYFSKVLSIKPGHIVALKHKSEAFHALDLFAESLECAERLRQQNPYNIEYIILVTSNLMMLERHKESLFLLEEGLHIYPDDYSLNIELALALSITGDLRKALEVFSKAERLIKQRPLSAELISDLILLHLNRGGLFMREIDMFKGEQEQNFGFVLAELAKSKIFEHRLN